MFLRRGVLNTIGILVLLVPQVELGLVVNSSILIALINITSYKSPLIQNAYKE